jgi:hypothetical protein
MKKLFSLLVIAGMVALVACGPSAEEKAAKEKAKQDSIATAQQKIDDSIAAVQQKVDDSIAAVKQKAKEDSIANAPKPKATKTTKPATKPAAGPKKKG